MAEAIYARPEDFDLEHEHQDADVGFYQRLIKRWQPAVTVEFGCGSGRVTLPMARVAARLGGRVIGIDHTTEMLEACRRKLDDAPERIRSVVSLVEADMRTWRPDAGVDLIVVPCSTVSHLLSLNDQLSLWRNAWRSLVPGGRFVVDVTMADLAACAESQRVPPRQLVELDVDEEEPGTRARLLRYRAMTYRANEQRARVRFLYDRFGEADGPDRFVSDFESHVYFPRELELLFLHTGFAVEATLGDYAGGAFVPASRQMLVVGRRR